ncbi:hypothetical protein ACFVSW_08670 [Neobacillus sp. NPDC058068]|uniref:hypothetical protein n=1 Tax=Neobacillus sp. NPDC058068 TaxID=3346325 RepID=UPI0036D90FD9
MDILEFGAWFQYFLLIISGFLVLFLVLLLYTNKFTNQKINEIEQQNEGVGSYTEFD